MVDFQDIIACENVKRTMEVAATGNHSLLIVGPHDYGKTLCLQAMAGLVDIDNVGPLQDLSAARRRKVIAALDKRDRLTVGETLLCPCGSYGSLREVCRCSANTIFRHRSKLRDAVRSFDMVIGINLPMACELANERRQRGETTAMVKARVDAAKTAAAKTATSEDAETLLKHAISALPLTPKQAIVARAIAATSAKLDQSATVIHAFHMSEAIQYVAGFNNLWGSV